MRDIDGAIVTERFIKSPCGNTAEFDEDSGISYRCRECAAVIGSVGMPQECFSIMKTQQEQKQVWEILSK